MTENIRNQLDYFIRNKAHHAFRQEKEDPFRLAETFEKAGYSDLERVVRRFCYVLEKEQPVVYPWERIAMIRTAVTLPEIHTPKEKEALSEAHYIHEQGKVCNINPCYAEVIGTGLLGKQEEIRAQMEKRKSADDPKAQEEYTYLEAMLRMTDEMLAFAGRYGNAAEKAGNLRVAETFRRIPAQAAQTFEEALQFFRFLHYCLWCTFNYHNTVGRFDQYMYPYLKRDLENGTLTKEEAFELLEEFFISFNRDSDLYTGMQQGDNGQSMVLGGCAQDGSDCYNLLSDLCMDASLELKLIDPKINLRIHKNTPLALYEKGTRMTKQGLGFPQYSNDDVVIPALLRWGYEPEDAYQYVVAACWEFIIPGKGMDIPNIDGLSFADMVVKCLPKLTECMEFEDFMNTVHEKIRTQCAQMVTKYKNLYLEPSPVMSLMMDGCISRAEDISLGNKYNNFGIHGSGLSTAVDSLAAVKRFVYDEQSVEKQELLDALAQDYKGHELLLNRLRYEGPKMGNDEEDPDQIASRLLAWFAGALEGYTNERGGIYRAGTGSAMYYIWQSEDLPATPDGRRAGEAFACNYSPSLFCRLKGPVSLVKSFSKPDLKLTANGGPLTIELHDTVFKNEESIRKVAMLVKSFLDMGGHQMQINAVNKDTLLDAKKHPKDHQNLIVRVWGWSGYFVELDEVYQDHIIERMELTL